MGLISGVYQGVKYFARPNTVEGGESMDDFITLITVLGVFENRLLGLYYFPRLLLDYDAVDGSVTNREAKKIEVELNVPSTYHYGWNPNNNKMFTFPYFYIQVDGLSQTRVYKYEYFENNSEIIRFSVYGVLSLQPSLVILPQNYLGLHENIMHELRISEFEGMPAYSSALFSLFGSNGIIGKLGNIGLTAGLGFSNPNLALAGLSITSQNSSSNSTITTNGKTRKFKQDRDSISETQDMLALERAENDIAMKAGSQFVNSIDYQIYGQRTRGGSLNPDIGTAQGGLYFQFMGLRQEFAQKIDKFFDAFGYAVNTIKMPQLNNRPKWTYVRTKGCICNGSFANDVRTKIIKIFDSGVRFWKVDENLQVDVGNYSQDNRAYVR